MPARKWTQRRMMASVSLPVCVGITNRPRVSARCMRCIKFLRESGGQSLPGTAGRVADEYSGSPARRASPPAVARFAAPAGRGGGSGSPRHKQKNQGSLSAPLKVVQPGVKLEAELHAELDLTRTTIQLLRIQELRGAGDDVVGAAAAVEGGTVEAEYATVGVAELRMVQGVEQLDPELQSGSFGDVRVLEERQVKVVQARAGHTVAT